MFVCTLPLLKAGEKATPQRVACRRRGRVTQAAKIQDDYGKNIKTRSSVVLQCSFKGLSAFIPRKWLCCIGIQPISLLIAEAIKWIRARLFINRQLFFHITFTPHTLSQSAPREPKWKLYIWFWWLPCITARKSSICLSGIYSTLKWKVLSHSRRIDIDTVFLLRLNTSDHWVNPVEPWYPSGPCATTFRRPNASSGVIL